jgi:hypothetical protein
MEWRAGQARSAVFFARVLDGANDSWAGRAERVTAGPYSCGSAGSRAGSRIERNGVREAAAQAGRGSAATVADPTEHDMTDFGPPRCSQSRIELRLEREGEARLLAVSAWTCHEGIDGIATRLEWQEVPTYLGVVRRKVG